MNLGELENLNVNPDWAILPLFDRKGWERVRFGDVARVLEEQVDPASGEVGRYVAGEHITLGAGYGSHGMAGELEKGSGVPERVARRLRGGLVFDTKTGHYL